MYMYMYSFICSLIHSFIKRFLHGFFYDSPYLTHEVILALGDRLKAIMARTRIFLL